MRTRSAIVSFAVLTLISAAVLTAQAKPNFSGVWTMDPSKSDWGQLPAPETMTRTITHKDPLFKMVTVQAGGGTGERTIETTFSTDGKQTKNNILGDPMTSVGNWDGTTLVVLSTLTTQGFDVPIEDRYVLSPDKKTLTVTRKVTTPNGETVAKIVLVKK